MFGGFNIKMEYRCAKCEAKLVKKLDRIIDSITTNPVGLGV